MEAAGSSKLAPSRRRRIPSWFQHEQVLPSCCPIQIPSSSWGVKRARSALPRPPHENNNTHRREWADLGDGPAGLIAEHVLAHDVADYIRFRAVCHSWRRCSVDPRAHGCLDRRFHPRRWIMLQEPLANPDFRRFLNTSTGECVQVHVPELHHHELLAVTHDGLLVLLHKPHRTTVRILNPLTRHLTELPPFTSLLPSKHHRILSWCNFGRFLSWGSCVANDDSMVVLHLRSLNIIGVAKPGDMCWTRLKLDSTGPIRASSKFAGRFYCVTRDGGVMVLEDHPPRLELAAKLPMMVSSMTDSVRLVDCAGEMVLVHRRFSERHGWNNVWKRRYDAYRVDLDAMTLCRVNNFGGGTHALFIGMACSFSVPINAFPSGSIRGDTIYLSFNIDERNETEGYNLADRRTISSCNADRTRSVAGPHTLVDFLSFVYR